MSETGRLTMQTYRFPALDHLLAMTDDVGILQHATLDVPNRSCGYCTDDVGRALIVACEAASRFPQDRNVSRLVSTYLAYLHDAQLPNGWFHNFMGYDRRWQDHGGTPDAVGRAIWGLGYAERFAPRESCGSSVVREGTSCGPVPVPVSPRHSGSAALRPRWAPTRPGLALPPVERRECPLQ